MPRRLLPLLAVLAIVVVLPACAGGDPVTVTAPTVSVAPGVEADTSCSKPGVVLPNCGKAPEHAGDRGGSLQYVVWALLVTGLVIVFTVVFRSAKRTEVAKRQSVGDRDWS